MKFVWIIAIILGLVFSFSVAASFLGALWLGTVVLLAITAVFMAVMEFIKLKILAGLNWGVAAVFFFWLLSLSF